MPAHPRHAPRPIVLADLGERAWLRRVRRWMGPAGGELALGIGDDAAMVHTRSGRLAVTTDALIEGVHFRRDWTRPGDLGWKALAVNLSDLAAMGTRPVAAFLALGVPPSTPLADLKAFFLGMRSAGRAWGCPLAGGDLTRADRWTLAVTVLGAPVAPRGAVFRRDAGRPGDWLYVTGRPGRSGAGRAALESGEPEAAKQGTSRLIRAHHRPIPRLAEAARLARLGCVTAALDLSDGLWDDASKLAEASGLRVELTRGALSADAAMRRLGRRLGRDPLEWILFGGEDYELLFATRRPLDPARDWQGEPGMRKLAPVTLVGRLAPGRGVTLLDENGRSLPVRDATWGHF